MKKTLITLFLLLTVISYTKPYYSKGKEESIERVYNVLTLERQKFDSPEAQSIVDDMARIVYDAQVDSTLTSKEDFSKLNKYYSKRANAILERVKKNSGSFSSSDKEKIVEEFTYLKGQLDIYSSACENK